MESPPDETEQARSAEHPVVSVAVRLSKPSAEVGAALRPHPQPLAQIQRLLPIDLHPHPRKIPADPQRGRLPQRHHKCTAIVSGHLFAPWAQTLIQTLRDSRAIVRLYEEILQNECL